MPLIRITGSKNIEEKKKFAIMQSVSQKISEITGKPEKYILVIFGDATDMILGGTDDSSLFLEIKSIGALQPENTGKITKEISEYLFEETGVPLDRINIEFRDVAPDMWGWNGKTFG